MASAEPGRRWSSARRHARGRARGAGLCLLTVLFASGALARSGWAQPPGDCAGAIEVVTLTIAPGFEDELLRAIRAHLRAELAPRGVCVVDGEPDRAAAADQAVPAGEEAAVPVARVALLRIEDRVAVRVDYPRSGGTAERTLSVAAVPPAGRGLAIGLAASDLLTPRWLGAPETPRAPGVTRAEDDQPAITARAPTTLAEPAEVAHRDGLSLAAALAGERFAAGVTWLGPTIAAAWHRGRAGFTLHAGARRGEPLVAPHGEIELAGLHLGAAASSRLLGAERGWQLRAGAGADLARIAVRGRAVPGATSQRSSAVTVVPRAELLVGRALTEALRLGLGVTLALPLRPVRAADAGVPVGGVAGLGIGALARLEFAP